MGKIKWEMKFKKPTKLQLKNIKEKFGKFSGEKYSKSKNSICIYLKKTETSAQPPPPMI